MLKATDLDKILDEGDAGAEDPIDDESADPAKPSRAEVEAAAEELGKAFNDALGKALEEEPGFGDEVDEDSAPAAGRQSSATAQESAASGAITAPATPAAAVAKDDTPHVLCDGNVEYSYVTRAEEKSYGRIGDGQTIIYRTAADEPLREAVVMGEPGLPWALENVVQSMSVGDIVKVIGQGEYALADHEDPSSEEATVSKCKRHWRFELVSVSGAMRDKFKADADGRMAWATSLKDRGNNMLKRGRLLRAADYYERGSSLMDVIEAEDTVPGRKDERAVETNRRIRECQQPLLLNWALVLLKLGKFQEAERKCTEVLLDINKDCVKALLRRGQCLIELDELDDARRDLRRAEELDPSVAGDVAREMVKFAKKQKVRDAKDRAWMRKGIQGGLGDARSNDAGGEGIECHVKESSTTRLNPNARTPSAGEGNASAHPLLSALDAQERVADDECLDEITRLRQREALYNQFCIRQPPESA
eukprot:gnl/TRDRNA2_/TRDRNA2_195583_c0_seq1.p1 gnl/TRDRNA2_/TRDRNA2_195583_c0~~gnl/TRDRNA2_/TRDRNA2_195583_c0_seq1.p1  ORF type:complete len:478 (-),score=107.58 gnl/TRDRNA2_/TRDRNA2_195583_c0_seq1:47-1480(-)